MTNEQMMKLFADTAYIRTGGSADERRCADYILSLCRAYDPQAALEPFEVDMATIRTASLEVFGGDFGEGEAIECKGYLNAGSREIEAPFAILPLSTGYRF